MSTTFCNMPWNTQAEEKFFRMIRRLPMFHRDIAKEIVTKKAFLNAHARNSTCVEERDIVDAFFSEVPKAFYSLMVRILDEVGFDYDRHLAEKKLL